MKKNYEKLLINVISLDNADVITGSFSGEAKNNATLLDATFNFGDLSTHDFS